MFTSHRGKRAEGKTFSGKTFKKPGFRERSFEKPSFKATCADCGDACMVPFRPNGSKPVLCSNCFSGNDASKSSGHSRFSDREPREQISSAPGTSRSRNVEEQLKTMNAKLDRIILTLEALELD